MKMVLGVVRPGRAMDFGPTRAESMIDEGGGGGGGGGAHGQPTDWFGTIENSPDCLLDQDFP